MSLGYMDLEKKRTKIAEMTATSTTTVAQMLNALATNGGGQTLMDKVTEHWDTAVLACGDGAYIYRLSSITANVLTFTVFFGSSNLNLYVFKLNKDGASSSALRSQNGGAPTDYSSTNAGAGIWAIYI